jgi:hypothetical protein
MSDLTICPTSQPTARAASAAVRVSAGNVTGLTSMFLERPASITRSTLGSVGVISLAVDMTTR